MINLFKKKKKEPKTLDDVSEKCDELEDKITELSRELSNLKNKNKFSIQKMSVIRYNPFSGVGSNQSFSIALLDDDNNGFVLTSLYSRDGNRVYAKPVKGGKSEYQLSKEEEKVILIAIKKKEK